MKHHRIFILLLSATFLLGFIANPLLVGATRIRIGTAAPKDSLWHEVLKELKQDWEKISDKEVTVTIYEGGKLGDENEMVDMVRAGRIQVVALTTSGLAQIDDSLACLQIPMMIRSYSELDYVLKNIGPRLEKKLEEKGFKLLLWADAGWVRTFAKEPVRTPDDLRKMKLFTSAGDPDTEKLYKELGFQVTPLSLSDMIPSLQTDMINAVNLPPYYVSMTGAHRIVPYMTGIKWNPLVAGTVIDLKVWNKIPEKYRPQLLEAARSVGAKYQGRIRSFGEDSIKEMEKRGLKVVELNDSEISNWRKEAEKAYPKIRGRLTPAEYFDEVKRLVDEYREPKEKEPAGQ
ncbi:MAG: TRAP transporter substrate-binding protein DctP [Acidobacteriota bacterium]